jgi:hypothetical protein
VIFSTKFPQNFNQQRTAFNFFRNNAKKLEEIADAKPNDTSAQEDLYSELSKLGRFEDIVKRHESGKISINDALRRIYVKTIYKMKLLEPINTTVNQSAASLPINGIHKVQLVTSGKIYYFLNSRCIT